MFTPQTSFAYAEWAQLRHCGNNHPICQCSCCRGCQSDIKKRKTILTCYTFCRGTIGRCQEIKNAPLQLCQTEHKVVMPPHVHNNLEKNVNWNEFSQSDLGIRAPWRNYSFVCTWNIWNLVRTKQAPSGPGTVSLTFLACEPWCSWLILSMLTDAMPHSAPVKAPLLVSCSPFAIVPRPSFISHA